jgi:hypothetical protein
MNTDNTDTINNSKLRRLNWGALGITLLWLIRNGFLVSAVLYVVFALYLWPATYLISAIFFLKGTEWSWGDGNRWKSAEEFEESQFAWAFVGCLLLILQLIAFAYSLIFYESI